MFHRRDIGHPTTSHMEFRDGQQYDFTINNPAILTVDVGESQSIPASAILSNEKYVNPDELDTMMQQFSSEATKLGSKTATTTSCLSSVPSVPSYSASRPLSMELAEAEAEKIAAQLRSKKTGMVSPVYL